MTLLPNVLHLEQHLLAAHAEGDTERLAELYLAAGNLREREGRIDAACFFLTHAHVFALEAGSGLTGEIHGRLKAYGREE